LTVISLINMLLIKVDNSKKIITESTCISNTGISIGSAPELRNHMTETFLAVGMPEDHNLYTLYDVLPRFDDDIWPMNIDTLYPFSFRNELDLLYYQKCTGSLG